MKLRGPPPGQNGRQKVVCAALRPVTPWSQDTGREAQRDLTWPSGARWPGACGQLRTGWSTTARGSGVRASPPLPAADYRPQTGPAGRTPNVARVPSTGFTSLSSEKDKSRPARNNKPSTQETGHHPITNSRGESGAARWANPRAGRDFQMTFRPNRGIREGRDWQAGRTVVLGARSAGRAGPPDGASAPLLRGGPGHRGARDALPGPVPAGVGAPGRPPTASWNLRVKRPEYRMFSSFSGRSGGSEKSLFWVLEANGQQPTSFWAQPSWVW